MATRPERRRSQRLDVRITAKDRALIDRAVTASGTSLTDFVVTNLTMAARRVLAHRSEFTLGLDASTPGRRSTGVQPATCPD